MIHNPLTINSYVIVTIMHADCSKVCKIILDDFELLVSNELCEQTTH